jgi:hypothetical protein
VADGDRGSHGGRQRGGTVRRRWRRLSRGRRAGGRWAGFEGVEPYEKKTRQTRREEEVVRLGGGGDQRTSLIVRRRWPSGEESRGGGRVACSPWSRVRGGPIPFLFSVSSYQKNA